jgi:hypothetical protein
MPVHGETPHVNSRAPKASGTPKPTLKADGTLVPPRVIETAQERAEREERETDAFLRSIGVRK